MDLVGIDPTADKFSKYYKSHVRLIPEFFSSRRIKEEFGSRKAKIISSYSMFYDLEDPLKFALDIAETLSKDGI